MRHIFGSMEEEEEEEAECDYDYTLSDEFSTQRR